MQFLITQNHKLCERILPPKYEFKGKNPTTRSNSSSAWYKNILDVFHEIKAIMNKASFSLKVNIK